MIGRKKSGSKPLQWRLECLGHSLIEGLAARLPGSWVFKFGELLGGIAWHLMPARRRTVLRNLRIAFAGEMNPTEIEQLARETFRRSGANLFSISHTASLSPPKLREVLRIENLNLLEDAQARGKGVVLLLAHMGNWELLSRMIHLLPPGSKCGAFYRPLNNPLLDMRVLARRQADGTRMFSKRDPFHEVTKFLREGGIVGILADQRVGIQGEVVSFFGRFTRASLLPSLVARRAKAEVLALALVTEQPGKWKAVFLPVEKPHTTPHCMSALESAMKAGPTDVFWMQERWKAYVTKRRPLGKWLQSITCTSEKPHRALLWLPGVSPAWRLPDAWLHPNVRYEAVIDCSTEMPEWLPADTRIHHITGRVTREFIPKIDASDPLPLDYILTGPGALIPAAVAPRMQIRFLRLKAFGLDAKPEKY